MKFGQKQTMRDKAKTAEARLGKTTGASKGSKPAPKPKTSIKGTNPLKGKVAVTRTWKF